MLFLKGDDYPQNVAWDWGGDRRDARQQFSG